jgi:hypothetical protein
MKNKQLLSWVLITIGGAVLGYIVTKKLSDLEPKDTGVKPEVDPALKIYSDDNIEL